MEPVFINFTVNQNDQSIGGIECEKTGETLFKKGFNTVAYSFWYQFLTTYEADTNLDWNLVPFTIHLNTLKMYIQGERVKSYKETDTKN